jgi:hypothetical protein
MGIVCIQAKSEAETTSCGTDEEGERKKGRKIMRQAVVLTEPGVVFTRDKQELATCTEIE